MKADMCSCLLKLQRGGDGVRVVVVTVSGSFILHWNEELKCFSRQQNRSHATSETPWTSGAAALAKFGVAVQIISIVAESVVKEPLEQWTEPAVPH